MYGIGLGRSIPGSLSLGAAHYTLHVAHAVSLAILFHEMQSRGNRDFAQLVKKRINIRDFLLWRRIVSDCWLINILRNDFELTLFSLLRNHIHTTHAVNGRRNNSAGITCAFATWIQTSHLFVFEC